MSKFTLYSVFRNFSLISISQKPAAIGRVVLPSILLSGLLTPLLVSPAHSAPAQIIFDTDMNGDCDDAGTLAMLHTLQDLGECNILAITTSWGGEVIPGAIDAINTYYGHPDIPVGSCKWWDGKTNAGEFMTYIHKNYPHKVDGTYPSAVALLRQTLAAAADKSVTLCTVGQLDNIMELLKSVPDDYSNLNGVDLVAAKVKLMSTMGGRFPSGSEANFNWPGQRNAESAHYTYAHWPTSVPIMNSGSEIGEQIHTGARMCLLLPATHPVRRAYEIYHGFGSNRMSWDQTAALYAVRGLSDYWTSQTGGRTTVNPDGSNSWAALPDANQTYLEASKPPADMAKIIEALMIGKVPALPPVTIPAKIEAEQYSEMNGVQLEGCSEGTLNVSNIDDTDDWTEYSLIVPESGRYTVDVRVASENTDFSLDLLSSKGVKLATVAVGTTGGWQNWVTKTSEPFALPKGAQTFRVASTGGKWNLNWFEFKRVGPPESD